MRLVCVSRGFAANTARGADGDIDASPFGFGSVTNRHAGER